MRGLLMAVVLLLVAALAIFEISRLVHEFAQAEPDYRDWEPLVGLLAWTTAVAILIGISRVRQTAHRVALALIIPLGVVLAAVLMISGLGVVLLMLAHQEEKLIGIAEPYAVVVALLISVFILGGAALLARRGATSRAEEP